MKTLDGTETGTTLTAFAPEAPEDGDTTFLELQVHGDSGSTDSGYGNASCALIRRRIVNVVNP